MKKAYEMEIERQKFKKYSNSSYLTPEAASYLNEMMRSNQTKVDEEVVYAGLHTDKVSKKNFKRNEKYSTRYKKSRGMKRRRKGRFG